MAVRIEIYTVADAGSEKEQVEKSMAAIGFVRMMPLDGGGFLTERGPSTMDILQAAKDRSRERAPQDTGPVIEHDITAPRDNVTPIRERGKPAPGKARRTKEEIEEDLQADAADQANATDSYSSIDTAVKQQGISTGEERVDPADVEAQDKADEQTEVEQTRKDDKPLTIDDVKAVVTAYVGKYGMPAVQEDGPKIFVEALGAPPEGEAYWKMSLLPDDQAKLAKVVSVWQKAVELNPLKRTEV